MRRHAKASPARSHMTIGGMAFGLACLCLLAFTAISGPGAGTADAAAAECPNEAIRVAQGSTQLPDCRAYERVSPADTKGGIVGVDTKNGPLSAAIRADGDAASFGSSSAVGEAERGAALTSNLAHRTPSGWRSFSVLTTTGPDVLLDLSMSPGAPTPSADMSREMFRPSRSLGPPNPISTGGSIYLGALEGKGPPTWLSGWSFPGTQPDPPGTNVVPLGGSPDLSSGYFRYPTPLTDIAGDNLRTGVHGLYRFEGETVTPAGVLPSGEVGPEGATPAGTGDASIPDQIGPASMSLAELAGNQVSADGSKLFFVSPPAYGSEPPQLYVEDGDAPGRLISHDLSGNPAPAGVTSLDGGVARNGVAFATPDGSRVVFRSESALTADAPAAGVKTYRAEITSGAITLTYLPGVDTVLRISNDASEILFSTPGSVPGELVSFYVWDEDRPAAPYAIATDVNEIATEGVSSQLMREAVFSEDGDVLVFASTGAVEAGVPASPYLQIYRWTKEGGTVTCISCRPDGGAPAEFGAHMSIWQRTDNPAGPQGAAPNSASQSTVVGNRKISSDGSRVFFDTSDPLDPVHDVNGTRDVYMWENGHNYLLTSGRGNTPSQVLDSSESGDDVMLVTKDGLVPSDTNQTYDVYDVRVDGGFAEPVSETCEGDACQGQGSGPRQAAVPGSASLAWIGSRHESRKGKARARKAIAVSQLGRPGTAGARVRIQVPAAGKVSITGPDVRNRARRVKRRGAVVIKVGLSSRGKHRLARNGHLKATVRVTFRPRSGAATRKAMKLRFAGPKGGHR